MKDGTSKDITVNIQNTSKLDELEGFDYVRGKGRYRETNVYRELAADAEQNALDSSRKTFMTEPTAKEGKWSQTNDVPIIRHIKGAQVLEKGNGYVTKVNGENYYIQKSGTGWAVNYKGMIGSKIFSSLAKAKEGSAEAIGFIDKNQNMKQSVSGYFKILNKNLGRVSSKVMREISVKDAERVGGK